MEVTTSNVPPKILSTPGQIEDGERALYYKLAAETYRGVGAIVEVGALVGASTVAFAQGVRDNPRIIDKRKRLHSFDLFEITASEHLDAMFFSTNRVTLGEGGDFFEAWRRNTAEYGDIIEVSKGDATKVKWGGEPIEILFIDGDKSAAFQDAMVRVFYPYLIPGVSLLVEQDFFYPPAHAIPVKSQLFGPYIQPMQAHATAMVSRCVQKIPDAELVDPISRRSVADRAGILEQMATGIPVPAIAQSLRLARAYLLAENENPIEARAELDHILANPLTEYIAFHARDALSKL